MPRKPPSENVVCFCVSWIFLQTFQTCYCIQANSVDPDQSAKLTSKITSRWQSTTIYFLQSQVKWPFGSGDEGQNRWWPSWISNWNDFSYFWSTSCPDTSYQVLGQLAFQFRRKRKIDFRQEWFQLFLIYMSPRCFLPNFVSVGPMLKTFFLFFPENRIWYFMQIVSWGDNLQEMSNPVFWGKIRKISICHLRKITREKVNTFPHLSTLLAVNVSENYWMNDRQYRLWLQATFCGILSGLTLSAQSCLSE